MRVISGKAGRINLKSPKGLSTRPTADRIKETLFNMINPYIYKIEFLDLFAGSGAIGIEALSRGANSATFVDSDLEAIRCIKENLKVTKLDDAAEVIHSKVGKALTWLNNQGHQYDIIFMDPPYNMGFEKEILILMNEMDLIKDNTIVIVEASITTDFTYVEDTKFKLFKIKEYGSCKHVFLELK